MAPMTRYRATKSTHVPIASLVPEYYSQRSSTPGSLLITEATVIAAKAGGEENIPGIWSEEQIGVWKKVRMMFIPRLNCGVQYRSCIQGHRRRSQQRFLHLFTTLVEG